MKKINFLNENDVYNELIANFPTQQAPILSTDMIGLDDPERVYFFFKNKKWSEISTHLDLENDSYALELGISFLPEETFIYYLPLYIYASLFNRVSFWVFESNFIQHYLCPESQNHDNFLNFTLKFSDFQLSVIAQFMLYESETLGFSYAKKAYQEFWVDFI
ncbi:TPA: hypothetical protein QCG56_004834 [Enterobacter cancerogenus]|nr:hypothetical protein [Enterobacter cancerogenus]HDR2167853.1 hypothetical protein [Enterobacter cancerogenus]HDR2270494.1 hypothetical protein [Enterobacter cancerogenus]